MHCKADLGGGFSLHSRASGETKPAMNRRSALARGGRGRTTPSLLPGRERERILSYGLAIQRIIKEKEKYLKTDAQTHP